VLLALWLFAQLNPTTLLFGAGDLRDLLTDVAGPAHAPRLFVSIEAFTAAGNLIAVSLLASLLMRPRHRCVASCSPLLGAALTVRCWRLQC
jgi:hypothetical protein